MPRLKRKEKARKAAAASLAAVKRRKLEKQAEIQQQLLGAEKRKSDPNGESLPDAPSHQQSSSGGDSTVATDGETVLEYSPMGRVTPSVVEPEDVKEEDEPEEKVLGSDALKYNGGGDDRDGVPMEELTEEVPIPLSQLMKTKTVHVIENNKTNIKFKKIIPPPPLRARPPIPSSSFCFVCVRTVKMEKKKRPMVTKSDCFLLLTEMLEFCGKDANYYLEQLGEPQEWIGLCLKCHQLIREAAQLRDQLSKLQMDLKNCQRQIVEKIKATKLDSKGSKPEVGVRRQRRVAVENILRTVKGRKYNWILKSKKKVSQLVSKSKPIAAVGPPTTLEMDEDSSSSHPKNDDPLSLENGSHRIPLQTPKHKPKPPKRKLITSFPSGPPPPPVQVELPQPKPTSLPTPTPKKSQLIHYFGCDHCKDDKIYESKEELELHLLKIHRQPEPPSADKKKDDIGTAPPTKSPPVLPIMTASGLGPSTSTKLPSVVTGALERMRTTLVDADKGSRHRNPKPLTKGKRREYRRIILPEVPKGSTWVPSILRRKPGILSKSISALRPSTSITLPLPSTATDAPVTLEASNDCGKSSKDPLSPEEVPKGVKGGVTLKQKPKRSPLPKPSPSPVRPPKKAVAPPPASSISEPIDVKIEVALKEKPKRSPLPKPSPSPIPPSKKAMIAPPAPPSSESQLLHRYTCGLCKDDKIYTSKEDLALHYKDVHRYPSIASLLSAEPPKPPTSKRIKVKVEDIAPVVTQKPRSHKSKSRVRKSYKKPDRWIRYDCPNCPTVKNYRVNKYVQHLAIHRRNPFKCSVCSALLPDNPGIQDQHWKEKHSDVELPSLSTSGHPPEKFSRTMLDPGLIWKCDGCITKFGSEEARELHEQSCSILLRKKDRQKDPIKLYCPTCKYFSRNQDEWRLHRAIEHPSIDQISCLYCDVTFQEKTVEGGEHRNDEKMKTHISKSHKLRSRPSIFDECESCGLLFDGVEEAKIHFQKIHGVPEGGKFLFCLICRKSFSKKSYLPSHFNRHFGVGPQTCDICQATKCNRSLLIEHKLRKHQIQPPAGCQLRTCSVEGCHYQSIIKKMFEVHSQKVHGVARKYICKYCGKGFMKQEHLKAHERIHEDKGKKLYQMSYLWKLLRRPELSLHSYETVA